jgi:hypothetical protein
MFMVELDTSSHYSLLGVDPNASFADVRAARDREIKRLRERQRREPTNRDELVERQKQVNAAGEELARPAQREKYDKQHANLRFLAVRSASAPMFDDAGDRLEALYRAIAGHLRALGVSLPPLSDLDRTDFDDDLTPIPMLDGS